jgi:HK97 family phage major capsid protein
MTGLSRKADLALADLTQDGGLLNPEQNETFIRNLIDQPTLLRAIRTVPMSAPEQKINKIGFGSRILRAALQGTPPFQADNGTNDRYLPAAQRAKPQTSQVPLLTKEVIAEVRIPYEVLEDNIERGDMSNTVLALIAERAALDLEELIIRGDTALASSDAYLGLMDGILKLTSSNTVNGIDETQFINLFNDMKKAMPTRFRRNLRTLRYITSMDFESDYRVQVALRGTSLGDNILTGNDPLPVLGIPMVGAALMPDSTALLTDPQNMIFGIQRNIRIEQDRDIRSREVIIVLTARVALAIEEELAVVKATNLGQTTPVAPPSGGGEGGSGGSGDE